MPTETLTIRIDEKGAIVASRNIDNVGKSAKATGGALKLLKRALGALAALAAIKSLITLADTFTVIQNKLKIVTSGTENLAAVTQELFEVATRTRSSFEATASSFSKFALAAKNAGRSQQEMLRFTELVNKAVIIGGSEASEAAGGLRQLAQGIASGALRGDELISVLENLPFVADTIAISLGKTRGELRDMGKQGKITADVVFDAFKDQADFLDSSYLKTNITVGQSVQLLKNAFLKLVGQFDQGKGITAALAQQISKLADALIRMQPAIDFIGNVFTASFTVLGPIVDDVVAKFNDWGVNAESLKETLFDVGIALVALLRTAAQVVDGIISGFNIAGKVIATAIFGGLSEATRFWTIAVNTWDNLTRDIVNSLIAAFNKVNVALGRDPIGFLLPDRQQAVPEAFNWGTEIGNAVKEGTINSVTGVLDEIIAQVDDLTLKAKLEALKPSVGEIETAAPEGAAGPAKKVELGATDQLIAQLEREGELLKFNNAERANEAQLMELKAELAKTNQELSPEKEVEIRALQQLNMERELEMQLLQEIKGPLAEYNAAIAALAALEKEGSINAEELAAKTKELKEEFAEGPISSGGRGEEVFSTLFNNGLDALQDLERSWKKFVVGFLADLARMLQQQIILNAARSLGGPIGGLFGANGLDFMVGGSGGTDSQQMLLNATPGERVRVETPAQQRQSNMTSVAAPTVNLKIVNVTDPNEVADAMVSAEGEEAILNVISKNGTTIRQAIS